ncbi:hypothetical protein [Bacillus sp. SG-1]|uniref:hypothetical protein n=1 Tax=Bacillus sp. SG-1 TaxID=161544 RepID=UPI0001543E82|nr:hypothetical protein [Bacillus sp. SG-1]EDL64997.1 hypothetical protein BSG1_14789 [Bacillus sp. SG-1]
MKFFKDIQEAKGKYNERLNTLQAQKAELEAELADIVEEYETKLEKDALGLADFKDEAKLEKEIDDKKTKIEKVEQKIAIVRKGRNQAFINQIPVLKERKQKEFESVEEEWNDGVEELQKAKAEFLLALYNLHELRNKGNEVKGEFVRLMEEFDPESNEAKSGGQFMTFKSFEELPMSPNPSYFGKDIALQKAFSLPSWAATDAINGSLPKWVSHYAATGEIKFDDKK